MDRRRFLTLFAGAAAAIAADPEQLLWTPGEKTIFVPPAGGWRTWENADALRYLWSGAFLDPAAHQLEAARYVVISPTMSASEFTRLYESQPMPPEWPEGIKAAAKDLADRIDAEGLKLYEQAWRDQQSPVRFTVHPRAECDRDAAAAMQGIVDHIANEPEVKAAIAEEMRHEIWYGGRRAGKATRLREALECALKERA